MDKRPADVVRDQLTHYLGPYTSKNAVRMMAKQALSLEPEQVTIEQVPMLLEALGPTLRTLLGKVCAEQVLEEIRLTLAVSRPAGGVHT